MRLAAAVPVTAAARPRAPPTRNTRIRTVVAPAGGRTVTGSPWARSAAAWIAGATCTATRPTRPRP